MKHGYPNEGLKEPVSEYRNVVAEVVKEHFAKTAPLSTRLSAATSFTDELREECALMLGWERNATKTGWRQGWLHRWQHDLPELHLGEIVAEIERRGWHWFKALQAIYIHNADGKQIGNCDTRPDRNIQLCAMTALAMAIEGEN